MTRERRLAVEMWEGILKKFEGMSDEEYGEPDEDPVSVHWEKLQFAFKHKLNWTANCWLCNYISKCRRCPLSDGFNNCVRQRIACITDVPYKIADDGNKSRQARIAACRTIISVLRGELDRRRQEQDLYFVYGKEYIHMFDTLKKAYKKIRKRKKKEPTVIICGADKFANYKLGKKLHKVTLGR